MRTFFRATLITMAITLALLVGWNFIHQPMMTESAQAASALQVPSHCIPPELAGLQEQLAKMKDPNAATGLQAKIKASQDGAVACATLAAAYPPAKKPATPPIAPTEFPSPTPAPVEMGLQNEGLMPAPQSPFIPVFDGSYTGYNEWIGYVDGQMVRVIGGFLRDTDEEQIPLNHPEWQAHSELHVKSAVSVIFNDQWLKKILVPTSTRNGALHLVDQCENLIVLQAADTTVFYFDINKLAFVENSFACHSPKK